MAELAKEDRGRKMAFFGLKTETFQAPKVKEKLERFVSDFSIEVMPRTAEKIGDFKDCLLYTSPSPRD